MPDDTYHNSQDRAVGNYAYDYCDETSVCSHPDAVEQHHISPDSQWLEQECLQRFGDGFAAIGRARQHELLDDLAGSVVDPMVPPKRVAFFRRFRYVSVGAYYTTAAGTADVGYIGNVPISGEYPGPSDEALAHLATVLDELGLELEDLEE
jgi:hypothetical protein